MTNIFLVIFFSSVKFALTFPYAVYTCEFGFWETVLWTNIGGILGIVFFAYLSELILDTWSKLFNKKL